MIFFEELTKDWKLRDIPFLLITAEKEREKVVEAFAAVIKEYIVKPVKPESLGNKIKEVVFGVARRQHRSITFISSVVSD